jgi:transcriptional regulator with XRE-family HTH domain
MTAEGAAIATISEMPESRTARADRRVHAMRVSIGGELRIARLAAGLTLAQAGRAIEISASEARRIELATAPWVTLEKLCRFAAVVGLDLWVRTYAGGEPLRDRGHLRLTHAFRAFVGPGLSVQAEVPIGDHRDLRAWDLTLTDRRDDGCGVELETRLIDAQDQVRRITRKVADSGIGRVLLVLADTRANRDSVRAARALLGATFTLDDLMAREALAMGRIPPRNALIFVPLDAGVAGDTDPPHGNRRHRRRLRGRRLPPHGNHQPSLSRADKYGDRRVVRRRLLSSHGKRRGASGRRNA